MTAASFSVVQDGPNLVARFPASWLRVLRGERRRLEGVFAAVPTARFACNGPMVASRLGTNMTLLRDRAAGLDQPSRKLDEGATIWVEGGLARGAYGGLAPEHAAVAVQGWPSLVVDGRVSATDVGTNRERDDRAGVGATEDGQLLIVVHRGPMTALSGAMLAAGAKVAGYLDGGSSLQAGGAGTRVESPRVVPVPQWLLAVPPAGVAEATPEQDEEGLGVLPLVLGGAAVTLAACLLWYGSTRPRGRRRLDRRT